MTPVLWVAALWGCGGPADPVPPTDTDAEADTDTDTDSDTDTDTDADTDSAASTAETGIGIDCSALPDEPTSITQIDVARGYHDVAFDDAGYVIGTDGASLLKVAYDGDFSVFVPGAGVIQQMDWLPNGDLVYLDYVGAVIRATPQGATSVVAPGAGAYSAYGLRVGPDGMLYVATWSTIDRIDPYTGARTTFLNDPRVSPYVMDFSPDHSVMYIGTIWHGGTIWALQLDGDLEPVGAPTELATVGSGSDQLHDALGVDACGNLYVAEYYTSSLYRVSPTGDVAVLVSYTQVQYGHGLEWGSGIGGWRTDALYVPQPYNGNTVAEIVIGVPSR